MTDIAAAVRDAIDSDFLTGTAAELRVFYTNETLAAIAAGTPTVLIRSVDHGDAVRMVKTLGVVTEDGRQLQLRSLGSELIRFETTERMLFAAQLAADSLYGKGTPVAVIR